MSLPCLIVAYRKPEELARCVESVEGQTIMCQPVVHDNTENNVGLTVAINTLIRPYLLTETPYLMWLNQDVVLLPECAENAVAFMDAHPRCVVAGFKQLAMNEPDFITHGGCEAAYPAGRHITGHVSKGDCANSRRMPWVNMAACILRVEALRDVGLFNESMFLVGQDSAWCYEATLHNWEVWYCAEAVVWHECDGVSVKPRPEQVEIIDRDMRAWERWFVESDVMGRLQGIMAAEETLSE